VARVAAAVPDLLFGSKVQAMMVAAGHELVGDAADADVLVVDLTVEPERGIALLASLPESVRTLAFFSHVEPEVRERALAAGFDQVVPRSRMNREGGELVTALARPRSA
jgi:DNA-binding NarL/FixJ family response regulator